jgi:hypothetical protein
MALVLGIARVSSGLREALFTAYTPESENPPAIGLSPEAAFPAKGPKLVHGSM